MGEDVKYKGFVIRHIHPAVGPDIFWIVDPEFDSEWVGTARSVAEAKRVINELLADAEEEI